MSNILITIERVTSVNPHPNADRLEIVKLLGTQTVVPKGQYKVADWVVFFPPDIMIPDDVAERLGVKQYLKANGRVAACRLRGVASYGFIASLTAIEGVSGLFVGCDVTHLFDGVKYEPPVKLNGGDGAHEPPAFHRYTDIQHYYRNADVITPGTLVRITEKIHGTNSRVGLIKVDDEWQYVAGSHNTARKQGRYWLPLEHEGILNLLADLCNEENNVIIFSELYGPGIQDLDYGTEEVTFRVFDISVNGRYLNFYDLAFVCIAHDIPVVPLLYTGPFVADLVEVYTNGPTTVAKQVNQIKSKFKDREGCVITPLCEIHNTDLGRVILKSVSADYLGRKGGQDNE